MPNPAPRAPGWNVVRLIDSAGALHHRDAVAPHRTVSLCRVTRSALVLGSTQPDSDVDLASAASAGLDITRRRSGGGAVLVEPDALAWVDVYLSRADPLWVTDVGRAFWWLGEAWGETLRALGVEAPDVHRAAPVRTAWSSRVCFAGVGPGEVTVGGRKVVGMAQRRTRDGALFQCAALLRWDVDRLLDVLALDDSERRDGEVALRVAAAGLGPSVGLDDVEQSFVQHLP